MITRTPRNRGLLSAIRFATCSTLAFLLLAPVAGASDVALSPAMARYPVLSSAPGVQAPVSFTGNVGVFAGGTLTLNNTTIHGKADYAGSIHHSVSGTWSITNGEFGNVPDVAAALTDAQNLAATIAALSGTSTSNITSSRTVTAGVYDLSQISLSNNETLTLSGSASDQFIFRLSSLALNGGRIAVSGGALANNVFFYYTGGSDVNFQTSSQFAGVLLLNSSNSHSIGWNGATGTGYLINLTAGKINFTNGTFQGPPSVSVTPSSALLYAGQSQLFSATVTNSSNTGVTWSIPANAPGTVTAGGLYTAPASITSQQTVTVTATSQTDTTKSATATVTLMPPVSVRVDAGTASLTGGQTQQFTATVTNTSNTAVTWSIPAGAPGSISSTGLYTAPAIIGGSQSVAVTATSQADNTKSGTAAVTLIPVSVTVSPATAGLYGGGTQVFTATVTGTNNTAVTWSIPAGAPGSISASGLYTAPATVSTLQTVVVTATSQADGSKSGTATETLSPPIMVVVAPSTATLYGGGSQQFTATVTNNADTSVTWSIPAGAPGSISATGLYTAPVIVGSQQNVTVTAKSQADNTTVGTATVTLQPVAVSIAPPSATLYAGQTQQFTANVANTSNVAVTWSVSAGAPGSVSGTGVYTAPSTIATQQSVIVTVTSQADPSKSASAAVTLLPPITVSVAPSTANLVGGQTQQFTATVTNTANTAVTWTISPATGAGTISATGLYTAPATVAAPQTVIITATSQADSTKSATATITLSPPISVAVTPPTATLYGGQTQQFSATVTNASNPAVTWTISPPTGAGTISATGLYTAPATVAAPQTVTITATSQADSTKSATATITLSPPVSVSVTPPSATLYGGQTQQFSAPVTNTGNTAVTWTINPATGAGTISAAGLYTAPATVATPQTVTITATSQADSSTFSTATVTLSPVSVTITPPSATLYGGQTRQFTATVTNASNPAVTWTISPAGVGGIDATGLYTAPATVAAQQTVIVTATSQADATKSATAAVTLSPPVSITVAPSTATLYGGQPRQFTATVTNTSNTAVTWTISPAGVGSIDAAGLYTAPATVAVQQSVTLTAASQTDPSKSAAATITLSPPITVSIAPTTATLFGGETQQFTATVANAANTAVTWSINPSGSGSISAAGLYTAPTTIAAQQTVTVTATSQDDASKTATTTITLSPPIAVSVAPTTGTLYGGQTQQFTATVANTANSAVTWAISPSGNGSISAAGLYTAPTTIAAQQTVTVTATSQADGTKTATATITLSPPISVTVTPATATVFAGRTQQFNAVVTNSSNTVVTWSISPPDTGSIDATGLYTAPASVPAQQTVTVTATSQADGTKAGTASITLSSPITVTVTPATASLFAGQSQQFTSAVVGSTNTAVTWEVSPAGSGTITSVGLYTAPSTVTPGQTVTILARSAADPAQAGSSTVTLLTPSAFAPIRINSGGPTYVDPAGRVWSQDAGFSGNCPFGASTTSFTAPPGLDAEYATVRGCFNGAYQGLGYQFSVPNMSYLVTLKFAEPVVTSPGQRIFGVTINGATVLPAVDVVANAGGQFKAWDATVPVTVTNGQIAIGFTTNVNLPIISAIEIVAAGSIEVVPGSAALSQRQTLQFSANVPGAPNTPLNWSIVPPGAGTISATGLYTAPASIPAPATVTVVASSVANPNLSGSAPISLIATDPNSFGPLRINSAGPAYVDPAGRLWAADTGFTGNCPFGSASASFAAPPGLDAEYATVRGCFNGAFQGMGYQLTVPNMEYLVTLKFAEPVVANPGQRAFGISINGRLTLPYIDVVANAGGQFKAWDVTVPVAVTNGQIALSFTPIVNNPIISAIEIVPAGSVEVLPHTVSLGQRQTLQFSALTAGAGNAPVVWSLSPPNLGSISTTGFYTAPATITTGASVTVTATSSTNPSIFGSAAINLVALDPNTVSALRINAGGPAYTDPAGRVWAADSGFTVNCPFGSGTASFTPPAGLDAEYATARGCFNGAFQGMSAQYTVPNMAYLLTLKFADPNFANPGQRMFAVAVNGYTVLPAVDVAANAGGQFKPWDVTIPVMVTNGQLSFVFNPAVNNPIVSAIELLPLGDVEVFPSTVQLWPSQTRQFFGRVADPVNGGVVWSLAPANAGSITASGFYTAPPVIPAQQTVTLTATSVSNPTWSRTATINLFPPVTVSIAPASVNLSGGQTQQFTANLTNSGGTGVTWSMSPAGMGSLSASGLYTAPPSVFAPQTVTVTATSVADGHTATAAIHLVPAVTVSVSPATFTMGPGASKQFTAAVTGTWNTAVDWTVTPAVGSVSSAGIYTAPATIAATTNVTIRATSPINPTVSGTATLTISPAQTGITVSVTPGSASLITGQTRQFTATVAGTANTAVTWSVIPSVGTISTSGLYTAPAAISTSQTLTIQATSASASTVSGAATILLSPAVTNSYLYRRGILIDHTKVVNADQANFAVLVSGTYSYLASAANGGKAQSPNGYDILFTSDCAGLQKLDHEIESYDPATGTVRLWVLLPNVSATTDTLFYISYGNSSVTTSQENRASVDAARNATHTSDWLATAANNQNAPSAFYTIYPENANSLAPSTQTLAAGQTQQFTPIFTVGALASTANPLTLLGTSPTPSPAQSLTLNGNLAYVCDNNEVSVIDVTSLATPRFLGAALSADIKNDGLAYCTVQNRAGGPVLVVFADASDTGTGNHPVFVAFGLQDPTQPQLIAATSINKKFFVPPVYSGTGDTAFVPTFAVGTSFDSWSSQNGDVVAVNISNLSSPVVTGTLEPPVDPVYGGAHAMFGAALANPATLLVGGSTSTGASNNGVGQLVVADVSNPASLSVVTAVSVPNTRQLFRPVLQGNLAVVLGDTSGYNVSGGFFGPIVIDFPGNLVLTTFDITNPRSPALLANIVLPYKPSPGPAVPIGANLFLFGGATDNTGKPLLLLVDTTNPLSPVVTPYGVPAAVTGMAVAGNVLHVSAGAAGYAAYQIPGVTPVQYGLTGSCGGPVSWTLNPSSTGTLSTSGLYTAPASLAGSTAVTVTAASQSDPTQTASATVTLSQVLTLSLAPAAPGPYLTGNAGAFVATVTGPNGAPMSGVTVTFTVTGPNARTTTAVTDANGRAALSYAGSARGLDGIQASASGFTSTSLSALWVTPSLSLSTTPVSASFFTTSSCASGCEAFTTPATQVPVFLQTFPNLLFDPFSGMLSSNPTGVTSSTRPFTDIVLDASGAPAGTIVAQGNGTQAGAGSLAGFAAVFRGSFVVTQAGSYTFNIGSADGFLFGVGNGAARVSGVNINPPASGKTVFSRYPLMGANNGPSSGSSTPIVVSFPAPGAYPYEFDYQSGSGGALSFAVTVTQGAVTMPLRPLDTLVLTSSSTGPRLTGQSAVFTAQANDETGAPIAQLPVLLTLNGTNPHSLQATTDSTGKATFSYISQTMGADVLQTSATLNGLALWSNQSSATWVTTLPPQISVSGDAGVTLPATGSYTATITNQGTGLTVAWTQVSGPGAVVFDAPTQAATHVLYPAPGSYVLRITATDSVGSNQLEIPVTVTPPVTVSQGWIGSPADQSRVSGIVPIRVASGVTLASGTLSYYPVANPSAVVTLNANTTGSGQIGSIDTTTLANGTYYILLAATDNTGKFQSNGAWIVVQGDYKPGRVTTTVTDLVVPAPGLPIRIERTYDSLTRATKGDFGYGWTLGINVQLEVSNLSDVTLTINGQRRTFYFTPPFNVLGITTPAYTPEPGLFGSLTAPASNCPSNLVIKTGSIWICAIGYDFYAPQQLVYTDPYGRVYTISGTGSLQSMRDVAGNTLTVTGAGISSSSGLSVPFVRDGQGRITKTTDPLGKEYVYAYDAAGNLESVSYPEVATPASYTYDATHLYTGGTDMRGNSMPSNTYYPDGKLKSTTVKPDSNTIYTTAYSYDTVNPVTVTFPDNTTAVGFKTTITYPDGTAKSEVYDSYGKLIQSTDALLHSSRYQYDSSHNVIGVTDPLGHTTTYTYDGSGNRTSVTYPRTPTSLNTTSTTAYNAVGEPIRTTDENSNVTVVTYDSNSWPRLASDSQGPIMSVAVNANGTLASKSIGYDLAVAPDKATTYTYDQYGNLASETDGLGRTTTYVYDTLGRKTSMSSAAGGTVSYSSDVLGRLLTINEPLGRTTTYVADANGNKVSETDADAHTTSYQHDALNRLMLVTYPTTPPTTTSYTYDFRNNITDTTDPAGQHTHNTYDAAGRLTSTTKAPGTVDATSITYTYYDDGRIATSTDSLSHTATYVYDPAGRLTSVTDALGNMTKYGYDDVGNLVSITDPNNHITQRQFDSRRRLVKVIYDDSTSAFYSFDGPNNLTSLTDQGGQTVQYTYDTADHVQTATRVSSPNAQKTTLYGYDPNENLSSLTDANNHTVLRSFDVLSQLRTQAMPAGQTDSRNYDAAGNLLTFTDFNGRTTTYTYDGINRLLSKTPDASLGEVATRFTYTPTGKRATMTDASGTTNYSYDSQDRLKTKATPQGTLTYTYDGAGNLASISSNNLNGISLAYNYDSLNRLSAVTDNRLPANQSTTRYTYDAASNLATATYPNGTQFTFTFDRLERLKSLTTTNGSYTYTLGTAGTRVSTVEANGRTVDWTYDAIYRLTNETINLDPHAKNGMVSYGLDPVGNRLSQTSSLPGIPSGSFTYDVNDRLSTDTYDNNGNTIASGGKTFAYDFENRLKSMNGGAVVLLYDGTGNRVAKTVGSVTTRYLVDEVNPTGYPQVVEEVVGGAVTRVYAYGWQRISQSVITGGAPLVSFYGYDGMGSVRNLTDASGTVTDTYDYDSWGNTLNTSGTTSNPNQFLGEPYDADLGLYYLRARYLNPLTGRFLTTDPQEGDPMQPASLHKYAYALANPIAITDPTGMSNITESSFQNAKTLPAAAPEANSALQAARYITCAVDFLSEAKLLVDVAIDIGELIKGEAGSLDIPFPGGGNRLWNIAIGDIAKVKEVAPGGFIFTETDRVAAVYINEEFASRYPGAVRELMRRVQDSLKGLNIRLLQRGAGHAEMQIVREAERKGADWGLRSIASRVNFCKSGRCLAAIRDRLWTKARFKQGCFY